MSIRPNFTFTAVVQRSYWLCRVCLWLVIRMNNNIIADINVPIYVPNTTFVPNLSRNLLSFFTCSPLVRKIAMNANDLYKSKRDT